MMMPKSPVDSGLFGFNTRTHTMDIIIPYVQSHWQELKYAIRSWHKHFNHDFRIVIVGTLPNYLNPDKLLHIPHQKNGGFRFTNCVDACSKMEKVLNSRKISKDFIITYDDVYLCQNIEPSYFDNIISNGIASVNLTNSLASRTWQTLLKNTINQLSKNPNGPNNTIHNFETHIPRLINKKKMRDVYKAYNPKLNHLLHYTLYFNHYLQAGHPPTPLTKSGLIKAGFYGATNASSYSPYLQQSALRTLIKQHTFLNHNDAGLSTHLKNAIQGLYPQPSPLEL